MSTLSRAEFYALLDKFIAKVQHERRNHDSNTIRSLNKMAQVNGLEAYETIGYDDNSKRFVRVWSQTGTRPQDIGPNHGRAVILFIERDTGVIFGAKGWKQYNPNHEYGTLQTMDEWEFSDFYGTNKHGKKSLVPKALRR